MTERDIELLTELTGDRNPLHYDEAAAGRARYQDGVVLLDGTALVWTEPL